MKNIQESLEMTKTIAEYMHSGGDLSDSDSLRQFAQQRAQEFNRIAEQESKRAGGMMWLFGIVIFPYVLLFLLMELRAATLSGDEAVDSSSLIKFYDEYQKLRFVIASDAVIFLRSEENYVNIHYTDGGKTKKFVLRSSMRALEELMARHGLVRCHRSYFINPDQVKMIRKEASGVVVAELNVEGLEPVPISRKYQDEVTRLL